MDIEKFFVFVGVCLVIGLFVLVFVMGALFEKGCFVDSNFLR